MNPIFIDLGFLQIRYYSLCYIIALFIGLKLLEKDFLREKIPLQKDKIHNLVFFAFFCGILMARLYYVIFNSSYYFGHQVPWYEFLAVWKGGLAIHGGIIGGLLGSYIGCRFYKLNFCRILDFCATALLLGQAIGRIGNFMNGDAHGVPTNLPWGIVFAYGPASREFPNIPLHPVMLYELILNFFGFLILLKLKKQHYKAGFVAACYLLIYSAVRSFVTIFRADDLYFYNIRAPHLISIIGVAVALIWIFTQQLYKKKAT